MLTWSHLGRLQDDPRGAPEPPRPPHERPKGIQEAAKTIPGGSKKASRDPKSRPRGLKSLENHTRMLQKKLEVSFQALTAEVVFHMHIIYNALTLRVPSTTLLNQHDNLDPKKRTATLDSRRPQGNSKESPNMQIYNGNTKCMWTCDSICPGYSM